VSDVDSVVREALSSRAEQIRLNVADPLPGVQRRAAQIRFRRAVAVAAPFVVGFAVVTTVATISLRAGGSGVTTTPADTGSVTSSESPTSTTSSSKSSPATTATSPDTQASSTSLVPKTRQEALAWGLAANPDVIYEMTFRIKPQGVLECGLKVLGEAPAKGELYAWVRCQDYFAENGTIKEGAGAALPAAIHVEGSGPDTAITKVVFPRQASLVADIRRLFPVALQDTMTTGNIPIDTTGWPAHAKQELAGQVTHQVPTPPSG
jgi:hypothetical protein